MERGADRGDATGSGVHTGGTDQEGVHTGGTQQGGGVRPGRCPPCAPLSIDLEKKSSIVYVTYLLIKFIFLN